MAKEITTTTVTKPDAPKPIPPKMSVNERIQVSRFIARFVVALSALAIFAYIVHVMLGSADELPTSSKDLLNILIGAFIPLLVVSQNTILRVEVIYTKKKKRTP